jgi:hypothetical protein
MVANRRLFRALELSPAPEIVDLRPDGTMYGTAEDDVEISDESFSLEEIDGTTKISSNWTSTCRTC